jgi:predicted RNA-binding protein YlxR (DUF448 family)
MLALAEPADLLADSLPDLDNGPRTTKSGTQRMCAVTRSVRPIDELIRFVVSPSGDAIPDLKRKLPGRGLWVSASHKAVSEAARRNLFGKGFKRKVQISPTLAQDTDDLLVRGIVEALAMAAKAGQLVSGSTRVETALEARQARALIHAADGAADGIRKLDAIFRQTGGNTDAPHEFPVINVLTSAQLDLALGRSNVIHAALLAGPAGKTFLSRCQTLVQYRLADDGNAGGATARLAD